MSASPSDTIAAISTAPGRGGIGVVRVSGPQTRTIAQQVLGRVPEHRRVELRAFRDADGSAIDTGLALFCAALDEKFLPKLRGETAEASPVKRTTRRKTKDGRRK